MKFSYTKQIVAILLFFISSVASLFAQSGNPFITNFLLSDYIDKENWSIVQDNNGVMLFANRKGILCFDSEEWSLVRTPNFPYTLVKDDKSEKIFVGCRENFGYIQKTDTGRYIYHSLSEKYTEIGDIRNIVVAGDYVYFVSDLSLTRIEKNDLTRQKHWQAGEINSFMGLFGINNKAYINIYPKGLFEIGKDTFNFIAGTEALALSEVILSISTNNNANIIGTNRNEFYLFNGKNLSRYLLKDQKYISETTLTGGIDLDNFRFALSTLTGGCLVIEKYSGKTLYSINYRTGLPDDEVLALGQDNTNALWVAHQYGFSRVDFDFPAKSFNSYPGIEGNLISVTELSGTLYVATSKGVFFLKEEKGYKEITEPASNDENKTFSNDIVSPVTTSSSSTITTATTANNESKKSWWQRRKNKETTSTTEPSTNAEITTSSTTNTALLQAKIEENRLQNTNKKVYELISVSHEYQKVTGISEKCRQFVKVGNKLFVLASTGIYDVSDGSAKNILKRNDINSIIASEKNNRIFVATSQGVISISGNNSWSVEDDFDEVEENAYSLALIDNFLWIGSENKVYRAELDGDDKPIRWFSRKINSDYLEKVIVRNIGGVPYFFLSNAFYSFRKDSLLLEYKAEGELESAPRYVFCDDGNTWINKETTWFNLSDSIRTKSTSAYLNVFENIKSIYLDSKRNIWVISNNNLNKITLSEKDQYQPEFDLVVKNISDNSGLNFNIHVVKMSYGRNPFTFHIVAPSFLKEKSTQYQYLVEGINKTWSEWSTSSTITLTYLPPGSYTLKVRARNVLGKISEVKSVSFTIKPPFYRTWWFIAFEILLVIAAIFLFIRFRERKLQHDKEVLEQKVRERTAEIERQKNEITAQKKDITDSILYAKRIQQAMLPPDEKIAQHLPQHFILFRPRDIVSGDFYWMDHRNDVSVITAADCTGHGVPGAFMSMLGISLLNQIFAKTEQIKANELLNSLRSNVIKNLHQTGKEGEARDGMDISLCAIEHKNGKLQFAGAYNSLYIVRNKEVIELKADKMPIGIHSTEASFTNNEFDFKKGDTLYLLSDGYVDQFGGEAGKKFMAKRFKELILRINELSMDKQRESLEKSIEDWKGQVSQVDDILVIGVKL
jgi:serine phosphatase RsbU (regulator of sigma subunit)/ligand-binding sensor domain-containing protein